MRFSGAAEMLRMADPERAEAHLYLGAAIEEQGRHWEAREALRRAMERTRRMPQRGTTSRQEFRLPLEKNGRNDKAQEFLAGFRIPISK